MHLSIILHLAVATACLFMATSCSETPPMRLADIRRAPQGFIELSGDRLPNTRVDLNHARRTAEPMDADSIELTVYRDEPHYFPVDMCHRANEMLNAFRVTSDSAFLRNAERYVRKLQSLSVRVDSALFVQHLMNYYLHGNNGVHLIPPWVSGMAQGEFLGVAVRCFETTGDSSYLALAHQLFNSLRRLQTDGRPWVSRIDDDRYFWIEEFPHETRPGMTLNGYIAALFGVYDYYRLTKSDAALALYEASLTTIKHYLPQFRRPGNFSYYCLGHKSPANADYHNLHISMCRHLHRMTGDDFFRDMADQLESDTSSQRADAED